jgi:hypothetical protein
MYTQVLTLFELLDRDDSGSLDFKEYLYGLALVNESAANRKTLIKLAFKSFDQEGDGMLSLPQLASLFAFNPDIRPAQVSDLFVAADKDGDGRITFAQFEELLESRGDALDMMSVSFVDKSMQLSTHRNRRKERDKPVFEWWTPIYAVLLVWVCGASRPIVTTVALLGRYTPYTIHYTLYTIHYTLYTIHYTLCNIHYALYSLYTHHTLQRGIVRAMAQQHVRSADTQICTPSSNDGARKTGCRQGC